MFRSGGRRERQARPRPNATDERAKAPSERMQCKGQKVALKTTRATSCDHDNGASRPRQAGSRQAGWPAGRQADRQGYRLKKGSRFKPVALTERKNNATPKRLSGQRQHTRHTDSGGHTKPKTPATKNQSPPLLTHEAAGENTAEVEVAPALCEEGRPCEAHEDCGGRQQSGY